MAAHEEVKDLVSHLEDRLPECSPNLLAVLRQAVGGPRNDSSLGDLGGQAFEELYARLSRVGVECAAGMLRRYRRPESDSEPIALQALARLWKAGLDDRQWRLSLGDVETYYLMIVRREVVTEIRKGRPVRPLPDDDVGPGTDWLDAFGNREEVRAVLGQLPDRLREVLDLLMAGYSREEVAKHLGREKSWVYRATHQAYEQLRELWTKRQRRQEDAAWMEALLDQEQAHRVIALLKPGEQELLVLLLGGLSVREISEVVNRPVGDIRRDVLSAKTRFALLWDEQRKLASP